MIKTPAKPKKTRWRREIIERTKKGGIKTRPPAEKTRVILDDASVELVERFLKEIHCSSEETIEVIVIKHHTDNQKHERKKTIVTSIHEHTGMLRDIK